MENESRTSSLISQITPAADSAGRHGTFFAGSTHVALTNPTIVNVLGSYYGNVGHGLNQGDSIALQPTLNYQNDNLEHFNLPTTLDEQSTANRGEHPIVEPAVPLRRLKIKSGAELYRELGDGNYGTPLYIPQPNARLSKADRREGLHPGSVGKLTSAGSFDVLHNNVFGNTLTSGASTPAIQTPFNDDDIIEFKQFSAGNFLAAPGIYRKSLDSTSSRTIAAFGCDTDTEEGALLMLPQGAHCEHLANTEKLFDYIVQSGPALYAYANNIRGRRFKNGDLSIVYNCHKSVSWAIATFQNTSRECTVKMNLVENNYSVHSGSQSAGARYAWDYQGTVRAKIGPEDENDDLAGREDEPQVSSLRNQCLFIRTIKIRLAEDVWNQLFPGKDVTVGLQDRDVDFFQINSQHGQSASPPPPSSLSPSPLGLPSTSLSSLFSHSELPRLQGSENIPATFR
ncbi:hypothetical protein HYPSUDRAFT_66779 [Hypholoma sublateritium FD-334 SS-4]|uniref:Uncharacterized protein n=1 Tax=Hypholoma sublateritium (strain FD-334 SS-4) TaxID=945553 RepID=A0A0D2P264_HYPSF|nr:hypothetical protein HYPSUDRAFT_66779 [Hypholoma sublateritium FD-334 SS-4]